MTSERDVIVRASKGVGSSEDHRGIWEAAKEGLRRSPESLTLQEAEKKSKTLKEIPVSIRHGPSQGRV